MTGAGPVYLVMAALYLSAMISLAPIPRGGAAAEGSSGGGLGDLRDGFSYVRHDPTILALLGVALLSALLAMPYIQLLPGFVKEVLGGGPIELGALTAVSGGGALFGALVIASLPERHRGVLLLASTILLGVALVAFSGSRVFWFATVTIIFVGVGTAGRQAFSQILLHHYVEDQFRGAGDGAHDDPAGHDGPGRVLHRHHGGGDRHRPGYRHPRRHADGHLGAVIGHLAATASPAVAAATGSRLAPTGPCLRGH